MLNRMLASCRYSSLLFCNSEWPYFEERRPFRQPFPLQHHMTALSSASFSDSQYAHRRSWTEQSPHPLMGPSRSPSTRPKSTLRPPILSPLSIHCSDEVYCRDSEVLDITDRLAGRREGGTLARERNFIRLIKRFVY
ncbi:hypothetical protein FS842_007773 [Serendipita sp. 407]|nr:hypothetical protein FS842_007773 [Serendipita sp. 407]